MPGLMSRLRVDNHSVSVEKSLLGITEGGGVVVQRRLSLPGEPEGRQKSDFSQEFVHERTQCEYVGPDYEMYYTVRYGQQDSQSIIEAVLVVGDNKKRSAVRRYVPGVYIMYPSVIYLFYQKLDVSFEYPV